SVEELAASAVGSFQAGHPGGPYLRAGHSCGGLVAWEMAQQLRAAGSEVGLLVLMDTYGPGFTPPRRRAARRIADRLDRLRRAAPDERALWVRDSLRARAGALLARTPLRPAPTGERERGQLHAGAAGRYQVRPYAGKVLLLRAEAHA